MPNNDPEQLELSAEYLSTAQHPQVNVHEIRQRMDLIHIQEVANVLARLITNYHRDHRQMLDPVPGRTIVNGEMNVTLEIRGQ